MKIRNLVAAALLAALIPSSASAAHILGYDFDEVSGPAINNGSASNPNANGTLEGGAVRSFDTPGGFGSSIDLRDDGSTYAHVLSGDVDELDGLSAITLTTWLKLEEYTSGNARLSAKQAAGSFGGFNWSLNAAPNDGPVGPDNFRLGLFLGGGGAFDFDFSDADAGADDVWTFLAVTYDNSQATNNTKFYIGGVNTPVTQLGGDRTIDPLTIDGGTALYGVGYTDAAAGSDTSAIGFQDDVRVYGSALDLASLEAVRLSNVIPEPGALSLAVLGLASLLVQRRRR